MPKIKFITCHCSDVGKPKPYYFLTGDKPYETVQDFRKCECRVDGKRITKHGRDDVVVELVKSKRKGYEWG